MSTVQRTSVIGSWGARLVVIAVALSAVVSVAFILFGVGGVGRVISTDVALIVFALLVWLDAFIGRFRPEWFEFASLATDAYLLLLWIGIVWLAPSDVGNGALALALSILTFLFVRALLEIVDLVRILRDRWNSPVSRVLALVSMLAIAVLAVMVTIPALYPLRDLWSYDVYSRIVASLAVVAGVSLVLIPLWGLLTSRNRGAAGGAFGAAPGYGSLPGYGAPGAYGVGGQSVADRSVAAQSVTGQGVDGQGVTPRFSTGSAAPALPRAAAAPAPAAPYAAQPPRPLAWPRLADGSVVPMGGDGRPDFSSLLPGQQLVWPHFVDGTPVPAGDGGAPLYR